MHPNRRDFLKKIGLAAASYSFLSAVPGLTLGQAEAAGLAEAGANALAKTPFFQISLAQWSLHKTLFAGQLDNLDFPLKAKKDYGINIVEYVSPFFKKQEKDQSYLKELKKRTDDNGITNNLIMVDGEGNLGDTDAAKRNQAVENHYKWIDAAKYLGCKTIRVNAAGKGTSAEVQKAAIEGLSKLSEYGQKNKINVIVENHGGYSSNGEWLVGVMKGVNNKYCGTLPDFGNFRISPTEQYDRYKGVQELLPYAKGISAKSHDFDANGNETGTDYQRMFKMIKAAGWKGIVGIEYEGSRLSEDEGIRATKALLERIQQEMV